MFLHINKKITMRLLLIAVLLAVSLPAAAKDLVEKCVTQKVDAMRATPEAKQYEAEMGYEIMVTRAMLDEFEMQCREKLAAKRRSK